MKKAVVFLLFLSLASSARAEMDCRKIFDQEMYRCLTGANACRKNCQEQTKKPDGSLYFNSGEIYSQCIKASDCDGKSTACNEQALTNFRACGQPAKEPETAAAAKQEEKKSLVKTIDDWIMENDLVFNPDNQIYRKQAELKEAMFTKAQEVWKTEMVKLQAEFLIEPKFDFLWEGEWPNVKTAVFDAQSGAVIKSDSWQNIYLQDLADEVTKKVVLGQGEMEIKVINANPEANKVTVAGGDFFDIFVIQTHFWVKYDPDKKLAAINVYEGEVEVRTKDGKSVKITPNGEEPGVLLISRRPSMMKLALIGFTLTAIFSGAIFLKKRKRKIKTNP